MKCRRCGTDSEYSTASVFNTDTICKECRHQEESHPLYIKAIEINKTEFERGNYCFAGIGLPEDLKECEQKYELLI